MGSHNKYIIYIYWMLQNNDFKNIQYLPQCHDTHSGKSNYQQHNQQSLSRFTCWGPKKDNITERHCHRLIIDDTGEAKIKEEGSLRWDEYNIQVRDTRLDWTARPSEHITDAMSSVIALGLRTLRAQKRRLEIIPQQSARKTEVASYKLQGVELLLHRVWNIFFDYELHIFFGFYWTMALKTYNIYLNAMTRLQENHIIRSCSNIYEW